MDIITILNPIVTRIIRMEYDESIISLNNLCFKNIDLPKKVYWNLLMLTEIEKTFIKTKILKRMEYVAKPIHIPWDYYFYLYTLNLIKT